MEIHLLPVLTDNYIFILHEPRSALTAVVDPALAGPVMDFLGAKGWSLDYILNTHHHWDHVGGNEELKSRYRCQVYGSVYDQNRIPGITRTLGDGEAFSLGSVTFMVRDIPGHTLGHIAYFLAEQKVLFCGDTLFSMGCGRLFEGTPAQMWTSLHWIKSLPQETLIYCTHEYTERNGRFALQEDPENLDLKRRMAEVYQLRAQGKPSLPVALAVELKTNPFLRAKDCADFTRLREKRNHF